MYMWYYILQITGDHKRLSIAKPNWQLTLINRGGRTVSSKGEREHYFIESFRMKADPIICISAAIMRLLTTAVALINNNVLLNLLSQDIGFPGVSWLKSRLCWYLLCSQMTTLPICEGSSFVNGGTRQGRPIHATLFLAWWGEWECSSIECCICHQDELIKPFPHLVVQQKSADIQKCHMLVGMRLWNS